ncbi:FAD-dependent oxidoreductase [Halodesulfurarchaeum sp. HSR-GB]|uniref:FAD-dependent oxidoreductase n=1 Tax=Halodesulfurarchaeum sp. HSR-GB TaxID=3074077 RepID=UPI0028640D96|nr:FAD-dependent oxidoreductase [Halodesulfurarchaeum sp. HSR-GB]MDR5655951.1 FAD-dependent oxidoreductase [Halodesulfurarchaeum sp. HSR-GB]
MVDFDVIVVGAGRAGTAAAYKLAEHGIDVALVERAKEAGMKNVTGGVLYGDVLSELVPEFPDQAPLGRHVVEHNVRILNEGTSIGISYRDPAILDEPNYTIQVGRFDQWFVKKAEEKGAVFIPETTVRDVSQRGEEVLVETDRTGGDLTCKAVVGADGVNTTVGRVAGIRETVRNENVGQSVKHVIDLDKSTINERFNLEPGEGAAYAFEGFPEGVPGLGYFLYTFESSIAVGAVASMSSLEKYGKQGYSGRGTPLYDLLDRFKELEAVKPLVEGGSTTEYQGILVPKYKYSNLPQRYDDRISLVGDAAGLTLNKGFTFRGLDFGIKSGMCAAEAAIGSDQNQDWDSFGQRYDKLLNNSYVMTEMKQHRGIPSVVENEKFFDEYPAVAREVLEHTFSTSGDASGLTWRQALRSLRKRDIKLRGVLADGWKAVRSF